MSTVSYFEYRIAGDPIWLITDQVPITEDGPFQDTASGLFADTTYEYRAIVQWDHGVATGNILTLETDAKVSTSLAVTEDIHETVNLPTYEYVDPKIYVDLSVNERIVYDGHNNLHSTVDVLNVNIVAGFQYRKLGTDTWFGIDVASVVDGIFNQQAIGLDANTTYEYRAVVYWEQGISVGDVLTFETGDKELAQLPVIENVLPFGLNRLLATEYVDPKLYVDLTAVEDVIGDASTNLPATELIFDTTTTVFFQYREQGLDTWIEIEGESSPVFSKLVSSLKPDTTYEFRAAAYWSKGVAYGEVIDFKTLEHLGTMLPATEQVQGLGISILPTQEHVNRHLTDDLLVIEYVQSVGTSLLSTTEFVIGATQGILRVEEYVVHQVFLPTEEFVQVYGYRRIVVTDKIEGVGVDELPVSELVIIYVVEPNALPTTEYIEVITFAVNELLSTIKVAIANHLATTEQICIDAVAQLAVTEEVIGSQEVVLSTNEIVRASNLSSLTVNEYVIVDTSDKLDVHIIVQGLGLEFLPSNEYIQGLGTDQLVTSEYIQVNALSILPTTEYVEVVADSILPVTEITRALDRGMLSTDIYVTLTNRLQIQEQVIYGPRLTPKEVYFSGVLCNDVRLVGYKPKLKLKGLYGPIRLHGIKICIRLVGLFRKEVE